LPRSEDDEFRRLVADAQSQRFSGWDFSWLQDRLVEETPPWDYKKEVAKELPRIESLLDLGTGGGELLSSLGSLPRRTYVTEGYPPNASVARDRLRPLGIDVVRAYVDDNTLRPQTGALAFRTESLDMVINRHESFVAGEVYRVLKRGGVFLTEQAGSSNYPELNEFLGAPRIEQVWNLEVTRRQISEAGLLVTEGREARLDAWFKDVGAVVYYLLAIPWMIEGFTVDGYWDKLKELHKFISRNGSFRTTARRFYVRSVKR
jgi:SAM-dependent methyltransferase